MLKSPNRMTDDLETCSEKSKLIFDQYVDKKHILARRLPGLQSQFAV